MSEWQTPKTDYDTDPEAPTGAIMNRIEGNIQYLKNLYMFKLYRISANAIEVTTSRIIQPYFIKLPAGHKLVLRSLNYYLTPISGAPVLTFGDSETQDKYFTNAGQLYGETRPDIEMETNTTESDVNLTLNVWGDSLSVAGWTFAVEVAKI